ncbi:hypothetical protein FQZ97_1043260 [compost metagenome]
MSRWGVSPRPVTLDTTLAPMRLRKPRPLLPMATASALTPLDWRSLSWLVTARNTLVFRPPHRPLSVVTTTKPAALAVLICMNGCVYSGLARLRLPVIWRTFSA